MSEIEKEIKREEKQIQKFFNNRANVWMSVAIVFAIALIAVIFWPNGVSASTAGKAIIDLANAQGANAELVSVVSENGLHKVIISIQGQEMPVYVTKDGKLFTTQMIPIASQEENTETEQPTEVQKSDRPKVELYVWGYCPYGVAAQGPLAEVATLLKASADFEVVPYYDGHGAYENQQNKIQSCIQKLAKTQYWQYAAKFVTDVYPKCGSLRDIACDKDESVKIMEAVGINSKSILACVASDGDALFSAASAKAQENGVTGSPTLIINGVIVNAARNAEAYKSAVCNAFNDAPSECDTALSSSDTAASGNC